MDRIEDVEGKEENVFSMSVLLVSPKLGFVYPETRVVTAFAAHQEKVRSIMLTNADKLFITHITIGSQGSADDFCHRVFT